MPRNPTTDQEKEFKRKQMKECALELFAYQGYEMTTITQITNKAGISAAMFYFYYESKLDLYEQLYEESFIMLSKSFDQAIAAPALDTKTKYNIILNNYINFYINNNARYWLLSMTTFENKSVETKNSKVIANVGMKILEKCENIIKLGIEEGVFKKCDSFKAVATIWAMTDGIILRHEIIKEFGGDYNEYSAFAVNMIFNGLLVEPTAKEELD